MKKRIIGLIVFIVYQLSLILTISFNAKYIFRSEPYYSETEVNEMLVDEYKKAVDENSDPNLVLKVSKLQTLNAELSSENNLLSLDNVSKENIISQNNKTIKELNIKISELEECKIENEDLIFELELQVRDLDKQNKLLAYEITENETLIEENNKTIAQLQNSITYYVEFISGLETDGEVFAIFIVENEVFNVQKLNKNGLAYLENEPTFDDNRIFNGWLVNEKSVDLSSYTLSCNTTFVADLSYTYKVDFMVDDVVYNSQIILENEFVSIPETPIKDGYIFVGWSLNKVDLLEDIENISVTKNTIYHAVFEKASFSTTTAITFNGYNKLTGNCVWSDGSNIYYSDSNKQYKLNTLTNTWETMTWNGLTSFRGDHVWSFENNVYYSSGSSQQYKLNTLTNTWESISWGEFYPTYGDNIWTDGTNCYFSSNYSHYKLDTSTNTFVKMTWNGCNYFIGKCVWTDGNNIYLSQNNNQYKLNVLTDTWESVTWNGLEQPSGNQIWSDGNNYYYSEGTKQYKLDVLTNTWVSITWNGLASFAGQHVWTDGTNYYYSTSSGDYIFS